MNTEPKTVPDQLGSERSDAPASGWQETSDTDLIIACRAGNEEAWTALLDRYNRLIYSIPLRFGLPRPIADEVFQETCLILLQQLDQLHDTERLSAWLVTVCRRSCLRRLYPAQEPPVELWEGAVATDQAPLEKAIITLEQQHQVQAALETLSPRCQALLYALFFEVPPPSYEEIAERLDMSVGSIGPTRARCLQRLRLALARAEQELDR